MEGKPEHVQGISRMFELAVFKLVMRSPVGVFKKVTLACTLYYLCEVVDH